MSDRQKSDEITLQDIFSLLWKHRITVLVVPTAIAVLTAIWSLIVPEVFLARVMLAPETSQESRLPLSGGIGGLASIAGFALPSEQNVDENLAVLTSRTFIWRFVERNDLMPELYHKFWDSELEQWKPRHADDPPNLWDAYRRLTEDILSVDKNVKTGLITVSVRWTDPVKASQWANSLVEQLNEYLRQTAIERSETRLTYLQAELEKSNVSDIRATLYDLIEEQQRTAMLANTQRQFAFRVLDPSAPPDIRVWPKRTMLVIVAGILGSILSVFYVLFRFGNTRHQPDVNN